MRGAAHRVALFFAPALGHRQHERQVIAALRKLYPPDPDLVPEGAVAHHFRALLPLIALGHARLAHRRDRINNAGVVHAHSTTAKNDRGRVIATYSARFISNGERMREISA